MLRAYEDYNDDIEDVEDVRCYLEAIGKCDDSEVAHILEDRMRHKVLEAIAAGRLSCGNDAAPEVAAEALLSSEIKFERWCA